LVGLFFGLQLFLGGGDQERLQQLEFMSESLRERNVGFGEFPHVSLAVGPGLALSLIAVVDS
jgi:hypothetical protein